MAMTLEETHVKVLNHLMNQDGRAIESGTCRYREPGGRMCAVGCLISDELYCPSIEGSLIEFLPENILRSIRPSDLCRDDGDLYLGTIQGVHDHPTFWGRLDELVTGTEKFNSLGRERMTDILMEFRTMVQR